MADPYIITQKFTTADGPVTLHIAAPALGPDNTWVCTAKMYEPDGHEMDFPAFAGQDSLSLLTSMLVVIGDYVKDSYPDAVTEWGTPPALPVTKKRTESVWTATQTFDLSG